MNSMLIFIFGFLHGILEILPISSTMHMMFFSYVFALDYMTYDIIVACHFGSMIAIIFLYPNINKSISIKNAFISVIPIVLVTFIVYNLFDLIQHIGIAFYGYIFFVALINFICAILLFFADKQCMQYSKNVTNAQAYIIGIAQSCAIIPGVSRAGAIITAARMMKFSRVSALDIVSITAIPTLFLGSCFIIMNLSVNSLYEFKVFTVIISMICSACGTFLSYKAFSRFVSIHSYTCIAIYRIIISIILTGYILYMMF